MAEADQAGDGDADHVLPDGVVNQFRDRLDPAGLRFLKSGPVTPQERRARDQRVHPDAHLFAAMAPADLQRRFQDTGRFDRVRYFVGPDDTLHVRDASSREMLAQRLRRGLEKAVESKAPPMPPLELNGDSYDIQDWLADQLSGTTVDDYQDYVGSHAAISEMVGSQLPGRERGPADAYRHILFAGELARRFGEQRAHEILNLHEREGQLKAQPKDEEEMDRHNNEVGIAVGGSARNWTDVISAARKIVSGSSPDGRGSWRVEYDPNSTLSPYAAVWLPEDRWANNPSAERTASPHPARVALPEPPELRNDQVNWYDNPMRWSGPDWETGYLSDGYRYLYGEPNNAVGPRDSRVRRAISAYDAYLDWLARLPEQWR
ncbi:MAG: DUF6973 domain-containing protein [Dongiaceae bacterium]